MSIVEKTKTEGYIYNANDNKTQKIQQKNILRGDKSNLPLSRDTCDSVLNIENSYNNYTKLGALVEDNVPHTSQAEISNVSTTTIEQNRERYLSDTHLLIGRLTKNSDGERIEEYMNQAFLDYFAGKISADEIAGIAKRMYEDILAINITAGKTDGNDPSFNIKLLEHTHSIFSAFAVNTLYWDMYDIGFKYAQETYGFTRSVGDRFCYYDADYFYASKELQDIGDAAFTSIAKDKGLSDFCAADLYNGYPALCFNSKWNSFAGPGNTAVSLIKDVNITPPRGFKLFFTPNVYNQEARDNGSMYAINAIDSLAHNGNTGTTIYIKVPKGAELWRPLPFWMTLTRVTHPTGQGDTPIAGGYDISRYISSGAGFNDSLQDFFAKYVNDFDNGVLTVWQGGEMTKYDVPFDTIFNNIKHFDGNQLVSAGSYNDYLSNFQFGIYLQKAANIF